MGLSRRALERLRYRPNDRPRIAVAGEAKPPATDHDAGKRDVITIADPHLAPVERDLTKLREGARELGGLDQSTSTKNPGPTIEEHASLGQDQETGPRARGVVLARLRGPARDHRLLRGETQCGRRRALFRHEVLDPEGPAER